MRYWSLSQPQLHSQVEDDWWLRNIPKIQLIMGSSTRELVTKRGNQLEINETGKDNKAKSTRFIVLMLPNAVQTWLSCEEILRTILTTDMSSHFISSTLFFQRRPWHKKNSPTKRPSITFSAFCKEFMFFFLYSFHPQRLHFRRYSNRTLTKINLPLVDQSGSLTAQRTVITHHK